MRTITLDLTLSLPVDISFIEALLRQIKMNALKTIRPMASRFTTIPLPIITRYSSAWPVKSYEFIETTEPRPGVGQGNITFIPSQGNN